MAHVFGATLKDLLDRVSGLLGDNDPAEPNVRWSRAELTGYINEGLREILARVPEAFAVTIELPLLAGRLQQLPKAYQALSSVEESINGQRRAPVTEADYKYIGIFQYRHPNSDPLLDDEDPLSRYHVKTFTRHPIDDSIFYVEPPMPIGCRARVRATLIRRHYALSETDGDKELLIRPEYEAQLVDWVMYRALSKDHESATAKDQSARHHEAFKTAIETKLRLKTRFHAVAEDRPPPAATPRGTA